VESGFPRSLDAEVPFCGGFLRARIRRGFDQRWGFAQTHSAI
jgi:hypothetical protein